MMLKRIQLLGCCLLLSLFSYAQEAPKAVPVIFDSDMGFDYDDVGALAMLHALAAKGEAEILATIASTKYEGVAAVLDILNTYFNQPNIPIGVPKRAALTLRDSQKWSDSLKANYPHNLRTNSEAPGAVDLYRKILSKQPDKSVTLLTVGFLTNIEGLLQSGPDEFSELSGKELVEKKVAKMVSMAGAFPSGLEFNVEEDAQAAKFVFENIGVPVVFTGFEIGNNILTGLPLVNNPNIQNSPVQDVYRISIPQAEMDAKGRMSWDQTAVLVAVRGHQLYYNLSPGTIAVADDGSNTWNSTGSGQAYLVEKTPVAEIQQLIEELMAYQPRITDKPLVVFVVGDHEYSSEITMPLLAEELQKNYEIRVEVRKAYPDHNAEENIPGLEVLKEADLAVFFLRWRRLPEEQVQHIEGYLKSGKPVIGLRTSTHAFNYPEGHPLEKWNAFGEFAFNSPPGWEKKGHTHYGHESTTEVSVIPEVAEHPVLTGVEDFPAASWLYTVLPDYPSNASEWLLMGKAVNPDNPEAIDQPVAWVGTNIFGGQVFMTTLGHPEDFREESMIRLLINAIHWNLGLPVPKDLKGDLKIEVPYDTHE